MPGISSSDDKKPMEQPTNELTKAMGQLSVTTDDSDKTSPSLSDMPIDVVGLITEKLNYKEQLKLRKVSKSLRALVDDRKPACKSVKVDCCAKNVYISFNDHIVIYSKNVHNVGFDYDGEKRINTVRDDFKKVALDDLASTLKNSRLQLDEFCVFNFIREKNEIRNVLESLNHQVSAKKIDIRILSHSCLFSVLPFLKPETLKKISISFDVGGPDWRILARMEQVALLEQWKQAEELEFKNCFDSFPMEYTAHFKRFRITETRIKPDMLIRIKNYLSKLDNFEQCCLHFSIDSHGPDSTIQQLGAPVSSNATEMVFHHPIPNSYYYFEFTKSIYGYEVKIVKKERKSN